MPRRPNAWPWPPPNPPWPGPGCACTITKPPSAIAPAATTANSFRFISLIFFLSDFPSALFCASRLMTDRVKLRLQIYCVSLSNCVIPSEVEESLALNSDMGRDYNFWVYVVTNRNNSVLYIGLTNRLSRRTWQHRDGSRGGFAATYQCKKLTY